MSSFACTELPAWVSHMYSRKLGAGHLGQVVSYWLAEREGKDESRALTLTWPGAQDQHLQTLNEQVYECLHPQRLGSPALLSHSSLSSKAALCFLSLCTLGLGDTWFQAEERVGHLPRFDAFDSTGLSPFLSGILTPSPLPGKRVRCLVSRLLSQGGGARDQA